MLITVTSEYTASSFNVCLYLMNSLVISVAPMWVNEMIVPWHTNLGCSRISRDQYWHNNQPLCIYGDLAYSSSFHLLASFSRQNLTPNPVNYNKAVSQIRVPVEWLFNEIEIYFKFASYTNIKLFKSLQHRYFPVKFAKRLRKPILNPFWRTSVNDCFCI